MPSDPSPEQVREALEWLEEEESRWHLFAHRPSPLDKPTPEMQAKRAANHRIRATALQLARERAGQERVGWIDRRGLRWCDPNDIDAEPGYLECERDGEPLRPGELREKYGPLRTLYAGPPEGAGDA